MNGVALQPSIWDRNRWLVLVVFIFLSQLLLIYFLSARDDHRVAILPAKSSIQLFTRSVNEAEFFQTFLASDPTLFATANPHGFSGNAWLKIPERNYDLSESVELPFWLTLNSEQLGGGIFKFVSTNVVTPLSITKTVEPKIFGASLLDLPSETKTGSQLRIEGDLASRKLIEMPQLDAWAHSEILSNTVAQVAVDRGGSVVSVRILSRSGLAEADHSALALARTLRFEPSEKADATWGKLIFDWQTVPLPMTNSPNGNFK